MYTILKMASVPRGKSVFNSSHIIILSSDEDEEDKRYQRASPSASPLRKVVKLENEIEDVEIGSFQVSTILCKVLMVVKV